MEKKSYISPFQIVLVLFISRLLFSTSYQSALNAGNSIQDILLSLPAVFVTDFIIAIPLLILLNKYPGHDLVECATKAAGRVGGSVVAILYFIFFLLNAIVVTGNFENYFTIDIIPDVNSYVIGFLILIVCVYGALKGIEAIMRVGSVVAAFYILILAVIFISLMPLINLGYLKPLLFSGTKYLTGGFLINYNLSTQIVMLAFLVPFVSQGKSIGKTYTGWNVLSIIILFLLQFLLVTVTGAFGSQHQYPLQLLSSLSQVGVFQRLDAFDMVSWILNAVITITVYIYLAIECLLKIGLNKHRRLLAFVSGVIVLFSATCISRNFINLQYVIASGMTSIAVTVFTVIIPLIIIVVDLIKGRLVQDVQSK